LKPGSVRIIGGFWKRTPLPVANRPGLRPTPDRVRETLFNWLGQDLSGWHCFDAFAGTGALGFEAASRGAESVVLVEQDALLVQGLKDLQDQLKAHTLSVKRGDGVHALQTLQARSQQLIFLDPPFDSGLQQAALKASVPALKAAGLIYLEAGQRWSEQALAEQGLQIHRYLKASAVHAHLLKPLV
jgi:16S rRNA (guanine966-N2)-methyltransferase